MAAHTPVICPFGDHACMGGDFVGDESCHLGYAGSMCAHCDWGYFLDYSIRQCTLCQASINFSSIALALPLAILIPFWLFINFGRRVNDDMGSSNLVRNRQGDLPHICYRIC